MDDQHEFNSEHGTDILTAGLTRRLFQKLNRQSSLGAVFLDTTKLGKIGHQDLFEKRWSKPGYLEGK